MISEFLVKEFFYSTTLSVTHSSCRRATKIIFRVETEIGHYHLSGFTSKSISTWKPQDACCHDDIGFLKIK